MITPRATRLVRVGDLQEFRRVVARLAISESPAASPSIVLVPTRAAADVLLETIDTQACSGGRRRTSTLSDPRSFLRALIGAFTMRPGASTVRAMAIAQRRPFTRTEIA